MIKCYYRKCKANGKFEFKDHAYCLRHYTKKLKEEISDLWRLVIYKQADYRCEIPGCNYNSSNCQLNAHHIEGKSNHYLRWSLKNGISLCPGHHTFNQVSAHSPASSGQLEFRKILEEVRPIALLKDLELKRTEWKRKYNLSELEQIYEYLLSQLN